MTSESEETEVITVTEWYYAVKNYSGGSEEQLTVISGEPLHLLDDSDNEWWYAISPRTELAGYVPALFIESTQSRVARVNAVKNKRLLLPTEEDMQATTKAKHQKKLNFNTQPEIKVFEEESEYSGSDDDDDGEDCGDFDPQKAFNDAFASHGLIRIYAAIWDHNISYKALKIDEKTTVDEAIQLVVSKFQTTSSIPPPAASFALYLYSKGAEKKLAMDDFPVLELQKLSNEEEKANAKFLLKKNTGDADGFTIRIFSDENIFKTIIVTPTLVVKDAIHHAAHKFKAGKADAFVMRMVSNGAERFLENNDNLFEILKANRAANITTEKFFLTRRRLSLTLESSSSLLRVYGEKLDFDVAYRAIIVNPQTTTEEVIVQTLEKYNIKDSPKDFQLTVLMDDHERNIDKAEKPLQISKNYEMEHPGKPIKFILKKTATTLTHRTSIGPSLKISKIPVRIYCDFPNKSGAAFKPILMSRLTTSGSVVQMAIEKFNIKSTLTIADFSLVIVDEETHVQRHLQIDECPLVVRDGMGKKISFHLRKDLSSSDTTPIKIYGNRVWPEERYKTIFIGKTMVSSQIISLAIDKFRYKGCVSSMFQLVRIAADKTETILKEDEQVYRTRDEEFSLIRSEKVDLKISTKKIEDQPVREQITFDSIENDLMKANEDVRQLLLADVSIDTIDSDLDAAFASMNENLSHLIKMYGNE